VGVGGLRFEEGGSGLKPQPFARLTTLHAHEERTGDSSRSFMNYEGSTWTVRLLSVSADKLMQATEGMTEPRTIGVG
jgi:hypothetical protein